MCTSRYLPAEDHCTVITHANKTNTITRFGSRSAVFGRFKKWFSVNTKWTICIQVAVIVLMVGTPTCSARSTASTTEWVSSWSTNSVPIIRQDSHETSHSPALQSSPRLLFANHPDGSQSIIGTWFSFTRFTVMMAFFGTSFLLACAATAVYYVLFVVTEPTQHGSVLGRALNSSPASGSLLQASSNHWTFAHILQLIHLAYDTYSKLDLQNIECQEKILCEFQRTDNDPPDLNSRNGNDNDVAASTLENSKNEVVRNFMRKVSNFLFYLDIFKSIPNLKEYQEAIRVGQYDGDGDGYGNGNRSINDVSICDEIYSGCRFSVRKFNTHYKRLFG